MLEILSTEARSSKGVASPSHPFRAASYARVRGADNVATKRRDQQSRHDATVTRMSGDTKEFQSSGEKNQNRSNSDCAVSQAAQPARTIIKQHMRECTRPSGERGRRREKKRNGRPSEKAFEKAASACGTGLRACSL